jgi:hypothetical protein
VRDQLPDLIGCNSVVERTLKMTFELLGSVESNQRRARDEAAIALG